MNSSDTRATVLVTGSTGLIGSIVTARLVEKYRIIGLDITPPDHSQPNVEIIQADLTNDASVESALNEAYRRCGARLASVIHLAAYYDFNGKDSPLYQTLTVEGTRRLLRGLQRFESVEQFVFSSSLLVMEPCATGERLTEQSPTKAEWAYPQSKLAAESLIAKDRGGIPALILRIAGVYDEGGHSIPITQNIRRIAEREMESYFFPGNAEHGQSFVHLDDLADCFARAVDRRRDLPPFETLLVGEQECLSYEQLQDRIGELIHGVDDWPTIRIPRFVAKAGAWVQEKLASSEDEQPFIKPWMVDLADAHYPIDNAKARKQLDWNPQHSLSQTLPEMVRRLKADPRAWYKANGLPMPHDESIVRELTTPNA